MLCISYLAEKLKYYVEGTYRISNTLLIIMSIVKLIPPVDLLHVHIIEGIFWKHQIECVSFFFFFLNESNAYLYIPLDTCQLLLLYAKLEKKILAVIFSHKSKNYNNYMSIKKERK